jgi:hypothetical protein
MLYQKSFFRFIIPVPVFVLLVLTGCRQEEQQRNNSCDTSDNSCCECTATYTQVGQTAAREVLCTAVQKQNFMTTWTNPLVSIDCRRQ